MIKKLEYNPKNLDLYSFANKINEIIDLLNSSGLKGQKKCGYMIKTATPAHDGGLWCNNNVPCPAHGDWKKLEVLAQEHFDSCDNCKKI